MLAEKDIELGTIASGRDIGRVSSEKHIWIGCVDCGKERWVQLNHGKPMNKRCFSCAAKLRAAKREITGERNPFWKGGVCLHPQGYIFICYPEHPNAFSNGQVPRARLVLEKKLGRYLKPGTVAHHINGNKQDDRPENLEEVLAYDHYKEHANARQRDEGGRFKKGDSGLFNIGGKSGQVALV